MIVQEKDCRRLSEGLNVGLVGFIGVLLVYQGGNSSTLDFKVLLYGRAFGDHPSRRHTTQRQERNKPAIHTIVRTLDLILRVRTRNCPPGYTPYLFVHKAQYLKQLAYAHNSLIIYKTSSTS